MKPQQVAETVLAVAGWNARVVIDGVTWTGGQALGPDRDPFNLVFVAEIVDPDPFRDYSDLLVDQRRK